MGAYNPSRGKNIQQMKAAYENEPSPPKPKPRKRDSAMLRDANSVEKTELDSGTDDDSQLSIREVQLLSGNGALRKKFKLLTKHEKDIKCFQITHYAALEYIAENKKKAFEIIKEQRQNLKKLNYLEQNTLANIKDIQLY
ncbi:Hypothetical predicted protein [Paramuricea clavata]|uniref:Uncharacterized protein n=1 Tax=Paramuricea clavata TaxID=317549 RepID=A0A6S7H0R3_PARCT|nr:Hypothetical predicted protein [Paramuricea clavata]